MIKKLTILDWAVSIAWVALAVLVVVLRKDQPWQLCGINFLLLAWTSYRLNRITYRAEALRTLLEEARTKGLIYWDPITARGMIVRNDMMHRIDLLLRRTES